jgi:hypothetical protein
MFNKNFFKNKNHGFLILFIIFIVIIIIFAIVNIFYNKKEHFFQESPFLQKYRTNAFPAPVPCKGRSWTDKSNSAKSTMNPEGRKFDCQRIKIGDNPVIYGYRKSNDNLCPGNLTIFGNQVCIPKDIKVKEPKQSNANVPAKAEPAPAAAPAPAPAVDTAAPPAAAVTTEQCYARDQTKPYYDTNTNTCKKPENNGECQSTYDVVGKQVKNQLYAYVGGDCVDLTKMCQEKYTDQDYIWNQGNKILPDFSTTDIETLFSSSCIKQQDTSSQVFVGGSSGGNQGNLGGPT